MNWLDAGSPFSREFQREQKRRAILSEASRLFNIHGARATRLSDVADALQLNKTSLYYYVRSKDDLVYQCYLESCARIAAMLDGAEAASGTGADRLACFVRSYFDAWREVVLGSQPHFAILSEIRALKPDHRQDVAQRYRALQDRVCALMRAGQRDHSLCPGEALDAALALFGLIQLTVLWLPQRDPDEFEQAADDFIDIVFHGVSKTVMEVPEAAAFPPPGLVAGSAQDRQDAFCRVACSFFNRKGFKATSLDEIADVLDVTKGSLYHHVRDKDELLFHSFRRSLRWLAALQDLAEERAGSGLEALQLSSLYLFRLQCGDHGPLVRFNLIPSLAPGNRPEVMQEIGRLSGRFGAMLERGIADGSIRPVDVPIAEQVLLTAIDLSAELPWVRPIGDEREAFRSFFRFFFDGLV